MMESTAEIMSRGMKCLVEQMGIVEAERFISVIIREKLDYTNGKGIILMPKHQQRLAKKQLYMKKTTHLQVMQLGSDSERRKVFINEKLAQEQLEVYDYE